MPSLAEDGTCRRTCAARPDALVESPSDTRQRISWAAPLSRLGLPDTPVGLVVCHRRSAWQQWRHHAGGCAASNTRSPQLGARRIIAAVEDVCAERLRAAGGHLHPYRVGCAVCGRWTHLYDPHRWATSSILPGAYGRFGTQTFKAWTGFVRGGCRVVGRRLAEHRAPPQNVKGMVAGSDECI